MQFFFMPKGSWVKKVMSEFEGNLGKVYASQQTTAVCPGNSSRGKCL